MTLHLGFGPVVLCAALALLSHGRAQTITHKVVVQPIQIGTFSGLLSGNPDLILYESETNKIFAQAGLEVEFLDWVPYTPLHPDLAVLKTSDTSEIKFLGQEFDGANPALTSNVIRMFFVDAAQFDDPSVYGFTIESAYSPNPVDIFPENVAVISIASYTYGGGGIIDIIAHELGHALSLRHDDPEALASAANLMNAGRLFPASLADIYPDGLDLGKLEAQQILQMRAMPHLVNIDDYTYSPVPEPELAAIGAGAAALLFAYRRRRSARADAKLA